ncbi:MAG TPA: response regulator, partial [Blastocatellia bacterium]|nr:response regulator [Blastocatellia bacterium]
MANPTGETAGGHPQPCKVLLVDDEDINHEMLELFLKKTDYSLLSAKNVEEAMQVIVTARPDILITDAMMPGESGFSLIQKVRARPDTADMPIILWTVLERPDGSVMDPTGQADITLSKPFYRADIMKALEQAKQLLERRRAVGRRD